MRPREREAEQGEQKGIKVKSIVVYPAIARLGNSCFQFAAAYSYALDHDLQFSVPSETENEQWRPLYWKHLIHPELNNPKLKRIAIKGESYRYAPLAFKKRWSEDHVITLLGYNQSPKYFEHHKDAVIKAMGFSWQLQEGDCAIHVRLGDARKYPEKHYLLPKSYYEFQMLKFPGFRFWFYSDEIKWCVENFGDRKDCFFRAPSEFGDLSKPEIWDLENGSCCEHIIGSASTYAIWMAILNRNPNKRCIFPKRWMVENWAGTTAADWQDVIPSNWERA